MGLEILTLLRMHLCYGYSKYLQVLKLACNLHVAQGMQVVSYQMQLRCNYINYGREL